MSKVTLDISQGQNVLIGELTRQTVMQIPQKNIKQLIAQQSSVVDLTKVTRIDTAGLAWLFYLLEQANTTQCQLTFSNIPDKLTKLISLSGVEGFLPLHITNN